MTCIGVRMIDYISNFIGNKAVGDSDPGILGKFEDFDLINLELHNTFNKLLDIKYVYLPSIFFPRHV